MRVYRFKGYADLLKQTKINGAGIILRDHLGGFDQTLHNQVLAHVNNLAVDKNIKVVWRCGVDQRIKNLYPKISFVFDHENRKTLLDCFQNFNEHLVVMPRHFVCSFNGSAHISRKLLVAALHKFGWFNRDICSKNCAFDIDTLDGHVKDLVCDDAPFYRKFFIGTGSQEFFPTIHSFGHERYDHAKNILTLQPKITSCFVHIVSETLATSYYPFVTEKFLYSVVTRGLFLAYAQPGWHDHLEQYYGFKKYSRLFDYRFDTILNPVERLVELLSMISKFAIMSSDEWRDLYEMEIDNIEYNYDHYFSGNYVKHLEQFC